MLRSSAVPGLIGRKHALVGIFMRYSCDNFGMKALTFHAGPLAMAQIAEHGLRAQDVAIVPAAAGGPKGLIFQSLDLGVLLQEA